VAVGDSFHSYRGPLARMIRQAGFAVRWVGSQSTPKTNQHCGTRAIRENQIIFLAQEIPSGKLPKYAYLPELNAELALLAPELSSEDRQLS